jgi:HD-GYP domain-containing protein (c-di-GMP phosphodiesterase class II)
LNQDRPYRKGMSTKEAIRIIEKEVKNGKLNGESLEILKKVVF